MARMRTAMTIAGSDCSGGAGVQADLKTFAAHGVYGASVITSVVAENPSEVLSSCDIPTQIVADQLEAVFKDMPVDAVKIGMLPNPEIVEVVADALTRWKPQFVVVDPVMVSTSGSALVGEEAVDAIVEKVLPLATVVTPNVPEMQVLRVRAADFTGNVLLKGGHDTDPSESLDVLTMGEKRIGFASRRIDTQNTHGTGCTLSSAIAANLALGYDLIEAIRRAKTYVTCAIAGADDLGICRAYGPLNHYAPFDPSSDLVQVLELN